MNAIFALKLLNCFLILFVCEMGAFVSDAIGMAGDMSLYQLCPYTDYCTSNTTNKLDDHTKTPCCQYCSCADECWKRGNCCPDKRKTTAKQPIESCEAVLVKRNAHRNIGDTVPRFYVTKGCPTKDDPLAEKCRGELQSSLEDFIWVTDRRTNKIYTNKHCAKCHGVEDYTPWQISTDCAEALNGQNSPNDVVNHIIEHCSLLVVSPSTENYMNQCFEPEITQCNMTGDWETHDEALETACNSFSQSYIREHLFRTKVYSNVYCFLCNSRRDDVWDVCNSYAALNTRSDGRGFTGILDFTAIESVKEDRSNNVLGHGPVCAIDEVQDIFQVFQ